MARAELTRLDFYRRHHAATIDWLLRSVRHGRGGSCAVFSLARGWSRPYPETTGYLVPTLLDAARRLDRPEVRAAASGCGDWLLSIQQSDGSWLGGLHPPKDDARPSVFNTGQILTGLVALHRETGDERWLEAALRGARWLASRVDERGCWPGSDYRASTMPSYYAHAAWPLVETGCAAGDVELREAGARVLAAIAARRRDDGGFDAWEFQEGHPAFTHTIAYTLWGLIAGAELLDRWDELGAPALGALERLARRAELSGGALPGAFAQGWKAAGDYVCLTGNAQLALCLLAWERRENDLRLVNAAAKLVDFVCARQRLGAPLGALRGAVAGSSPIWGRYMTLRYPNWAGKFHADALVALAERLSREAA